MKTWNRLQQLRRELRLRQVIFSAQAQHEIVQAAEQFKVPAALIASVLADERTRLDAADHLQSVLMRLSFTLSPRRADLLIAFIERVCGRSVESFSLGRAQMKGHTLIRLGKEGYLNVPVDARERRQLLLSDAQAPVLVAACLRSTADHWQRGGVNLLERPAVLGTLYSLGMTGVRGIHPDPQASGRGQAIAAHAERLSRQGRFIGVASAQLA